MARRVSGSDVVDDDGHSADWDQDDRDHADHQETGVEAATPAGLPGPALLLSSSLRSVWRGEGGPGKVLVAVGGGAAAEEQLGLFDVLRPGGVVNTGPGAGRGGGEAGHGVETSLSEDSPLSCHSLLPDCET